jgi:hypothetical protein
VTRNRVIEDLTVRVPGIAGSTTMFFLIITRATSWSAYTLQLFLPTLLGTMSGGSLSGGPRWAMRRLLEEKKTRRCPPPNQELIQL